MFNSKSISFIIRSYNIYSFNKDMKGQKLLPSSYVCGEYLTCSQSGFESMYQCNPSDFPGAIPKIKVKRDHLTLECGHQIKKNKKVDGHSKFEKKYIKQGWSNSTISGAIALPIADPG